MSVPNRFSPRSALSAVVLALVTALALGSAASGHGGGGSSGPSYRAEVSPGTLAAGTESTSVISLTQLQDDEWHGLGSVRITPPIGFVLTSGTATNGYKTLSVKIAAGSATVDYLDLDDAGDTATVTLKATVPCGAAGPGTWTVVGHSTHRFDDYYAKILTQDPSGHLTQQVSSCRLAFATEPATAGADAVITGQAGDPSGSPIRVRVQDGNGDPESTSGIGIVLSITPGSGTVAADLGGQIADQTDADGIATFAPTIDLPGIGYKLDATAGGSFGSATSAAFDISGDAVLCSGTCTASDSEGDTSATVTGSSNGGLLTVTVGLGNVDCNNAVNKYYQTSSETVSFDITPANGRTTVIIKLDAGSVTKPFYRYEECFSSPTSTFLNKYGVTIPAGQAGVLPWCANLFKPTGGPCVQLKWFDLHGNVYVKSSVPSGDPRGKI